MQNGTTKANRFNWIKFTVLKILLNVYLSWIPILVPFYHADIIKVMESVYGIADQSPTVPFTDMIWI